MGKNQAHKAMQRTRYADTGADDDNDKPPPGTVQASADGMVDASFHSPAWHAARIQNMTAVRLPYEEWQKQRKEAEGKEAATAAEEDRRQKEYRVLLDADRAKRLSKGVNHTDLRDKLKKDKKRKHKSSDKSKKRKKEGKDGDDRKKKKKKKSRRSSSSDSSSGSGSDSGSDDEGGGGKRHKPPASGDGGDEAREKHSTMRLSEWIKS